MSKTRQDIDKMGHRPSLNGDGFIIALASTEVQELGYQVEVIDTDKREVIAAFADNNVAVNFLKLLRFALSL